MLLALLSDTHDNIWKLAAAMPHLARAEAALFCGDLCSPFVLRQLGEGLASKPVHVIWGNNDGDRRLMGRVAADLHSITLHGDFAEIELGGLHVALNHYPEIARGLAASGRYDLVGYGHDHKAFEGRVGETLLLNPGEVMGMYGRSTIALVETLTRTVTFVEL